MEKNQSTIRCLKTKVKKIREGSEREAQTNFKMLSWVRNVSFWRQALAVFAGNSFWTCLVDNFLIVKMVLLKFSGHVTCFADISLVFNYLSITVGHSLGEVLMRPANNLKNTKVNDVWLDVKVCNFMCNLFNSKLMYHYTFQVPDI